MCVCSVASVVSKSLQPYMNWSPPGSSAHGILATGEAQFIIKVLKYEQKPSL